MSRGYEVFRPLSPTASCDLAVLKNGKVLRIEVKTVQRFLTGNIANPDVDSLKCDVIALVVSAGEVEIIYRPSLSEWTTETIASGE